MGMFDWVNFTTDCPECGAHVDGFQSKDLDCGLATVEPDSLSHFYAYCKACGAWINFDRSPEVKQPREVPLTEEQVTALGFTKTVTPLRVNVTNSSPAKGTES